MPVPLLDLRAQHAAIRDEVLPALIDLVDSQSFILGAPVERLERECDRLVTLRAPQRFHAVSQFYKNFDEVSEARVLALLSHAKPAFELSI